MALFSDIPFALRMLRKTPGFTAAAVVTLALAIGANTALFTVIDAVLLTPLPYAQPERLVAVWEHGPTGFRNSVSVPTFLDWRAGAKSFAELAASSSSDMTLLHGDRPQDVTVAQVTPNYFNMLGLGAALGRAFVAEDGTHGREHSVLLTSAAWRALFGGEQGIVGQSVSLNGSLYTVIGVLPPNPLLDDGQQQMFSPLVLQEGESRKTHSLLVYGRLAPGATLASAQAEMDVIASGIASRYPDSNRGWGVQVDRLRDTLVGSTLRNSLLLLFGAVGFILLVGSANVANLMLVRATARQKEFSIRAALGASSARLVRQFMTESLLVAGLGVLGAMVLGAWLLALITSILPPGLLPAGMTVHMDLRVLLFACGLGVATAALFGIVPALQSARVDLNDTLKDEARGSGASRERRRLRNALVIGEVAIAFCLLTGAALLLASLARLLQVDPGFNPQKLLAAHVALPGTRYASEAQVADFYRRATDRLKALPGVQQVAFSTDLPLRGWAFGVPFQVEGRMVENSRRPFAHLQSVTSDYFATLQIPMLRGRALNDLDNERARPVLVINQTLAEKFFPGEDPIGRHLVMDSGPGGPKSTAWEIVGVCGRVKVQDMAEAATRAPEVYLPFAQAAVSQSWVSVRTSGDPMLLRTAVEGVFQNLDPTLPLTAMGPMDVVLQRASGPARFRLRLFGALAVLGFLLSVVGIYSVRAYAVEQRQHEIGIRMALGATPRHVLQVFLREGAWVVAVGIALGAVMSLWLTRAMTSLLFSVQPSDPLVFTGSALLMAAAGVAASFLPARAAAKVDPASVITR